MSLSVVHFYGKQSNYSCGYCKQSDTCQSHGMGAHTMTCKDYQDLIDRGWRRSGWYCYKPEMHTTCCPSYTIKCDATEFRLNKSHKKIIKRMNKFLRDGIRDAAGEVGDGARHDSETGMEEHDIGELTGKSLRQLNEQKLDVMMERVAEVDVPDGMCITKPNSDKATNVTKRAANSGAVNPPKKAKLLRIERKRAKLQQQGLTEDMINERFAKGKKQNAEKTLEEFLAEEPKDDEGAAHRLQVKLIPSSEGATHEVLALYNCYQRQIHHDPPSKLTMERYKRFLVKSPLKLITLCTSGEEFKHTLNNSFALYRKYQTAVHNDSPKSIDDYMDFLVKSPLKFSTVRAPECGYGSFHQQYWLDDRLIAVAVIDVLPKCVSSVYFMYDPEFRFLSLGTYASLRELAFTRSLRTECPNIRNYYMGFYIHSCPKMRYKGNLYPSYLLCPETYTWHLLDDSIRAKLDANKYCRLQEDATVQDEQRVSRNDINDVLIFDGSSRMLYSQFAQFATGTFKKQVTIYASLVGKVCAKRMTLFGS